MQKKVNQKSSVSLYVQLANIIRNDVNDGTLKPGTQIPSEPELCKKYKISRVTVRNAIDLLCKENILYKKQGKGTYVSYPQFLEDSVAELHSFSKSNRLQKIPTHTHIEEKIIKKCSISEFKKFDMFEELQDEYIYIERLRYIYDKPAILEKDYLPLQFQDLMEIDLEDKSLFQMIHDTAGINPTNFNDLFYITKATKEIADYLELPQNAPVLSVYQTVLDNNLNLLYYNVQFIRPDRYTYTISSFLSNPVSPHSNE